MPRFCEKIRQVDLLVLMENRDVVLWQIGKNAGKLLRKYYICLKPI